MGKRRLCLNMIVKDEAHVIRETLENVSKYIDYWVISDTGSTDDTPKVIQEFFKKKNIPGEMVYHKWSDFGTNRTLAIKAAKKKADFIWVMDADDLLVGEMKFPADPHQYDAFEVKYGNGFGYYRLQIFRGDNQWIYKGVLHEFAECKNKKIMKKGRMEGEYFIDSRRLGARNKDPDKYWKDAQMLLKAIQNKQDPDLLPRYTFYLAQSFMDYHRLEDAIKWYQKRVDLKGWCEEVYISQLRIGQCMARLDRPKEDIEKAFKRCGAIIHDRREYLQFYAEYLMQKGIWEEAYDVLKKAMKISFNPNYLLFYHQEHYQFLTKLSLANTALHLKKWKEAYTLYKQLWERPEIRYSDHSKMIEEFMNLAITNMPKDFLYPANIISEIRSNDEKNLLFSITTCKRFNLFEKTMNSFLICCRDRNLINHWLCVDDNSSQEDREKMKKLYPFIEFVFKTPSQKGHAISMNMIRERAMEYQYLLHLEDDWLFFDETFYIRPAFSIFDCSKFSAHLSSNHQTLPNGKIMQVLFNRNYAEDSLMVLVGGFLMETTQQPKIRFVMHQHEKETSLQGPNCAYWPHFSLRPSILRTDIFRSLGPYPTEGFFERQYADLYFQKSYLSCFYDRISCLHIGKKTYEKNVANAYSLNQESQFGKSVKCLNMARRQDRRAQMETLLQQKNIQHEFVDAIDAKKLSSSFYLSDLFQNNDFGNRKGFIGCALSHLRFWKQLVHQHVTEYYYIVEDDILRIEGDIYIKEFPESDWDVIFLGLFVFPEFEKKHETPTERKIVPFRRNEYLGGTIGYIISRKGAEKLLKFIETYKIRHGIDYMMKIAPDMNIFQVDPPIVYSSYVKSFDDDVDSDIQKSVEWLDLYSDRDFTFYSQKDSRCDTITSFANASIESLKKECFRLDGKAFNTSGDIKKDVEMVPCFHNWTQGLYVRKERDIVRIKIMGNWTSSENIMSSYRKLSKDGKGRWNNIQMVDSPEDHADIYVLINFPFAEEKYEPLRTIVYQMEPWCGEDYQQWGVKTWGEWSKPNPQAFLQVRPHAKFLNNCEWHISKSYSELSGSSPKKSMQFIVSSIVSNKYNDLGQKFRIDFLHYCESKKDFGVHIYGHNSSFLNYKGPLSHDEKDKGLMPYRYYFMSENNFEYNYATEKIWEGILCECLCFYYGCPNLEDYIDPQAFIRLDPDDFEKSYKIMSNAIHGNEWENRLPIIRNMKHKILNELQFFPVLENILHDFHITNTNLTNTDALICKILHDFPNEFLYIFTAFPSTKYIDISILSGHERITFFRKVASICPDKWMILVLHHDLNMDQIERFRPFQSQTFWHLPLYSFL